MKYRNTLLVLLALMAGCSPKPLYNRSLYNVSVKPRNAATQPVLFKGVLPCADCPGIETELFLRHQGLYADPGTYVLKQIYLDRNSKPYITQGTWVILRGDVTDPTATVYQLNPGHPEKSVYYLRLNSDELRQLDRDKKPIDSRLNFTLKRAITRP